MSLFQKVLHAGEGKKLKIVQSVVPAVAAHEAEMERRSDDELRTLTGEYKSRLEQGEDLDDLLPEAFATVREAGRRVLGQRHYDVQVMGGAALHFGWIAEQKTGEGKTLVSTLPAYLNALTGRGVHLVTTNDYLARRDAQWMGRVHRFLGLDVGVVYPNDDPPDEKRKHYAADITYGTNNEFGFDYLRDNMCETREQQVQRGHYFAIVDEVDSILIDEARTPLIISGQVAEAAEMYYQFARIVRGLQRDRDYEVDEAKRTVVPTAEGIQRVEDALSIANLYDDFNQNYVHQLQAALRGKELFHRDDDYIVADGEVKIVDEFTGRILEGRRWSEGLHQAVEAKEGVRIKEENQTLATVTLQNYFRLYEKLSGMTGTAYTEAGEFAHTYDMSVVQIPTNRPMVRADQGDLIYKTEDAKYEAVVTDLSGRHETGQPVLVGTISVEQSEKLSRLLEKKGVPHHVLNAKQHEREANVIAQAGQLYGVTVATNMAGRGVDILLGGNPEGLAHTELQKEGLTEEEEPEKYQQFVERFASECSAEGDKVRELGGLYVLGTERHESRRIDNQLRGRAGRQGDPGESRFYLSLEDELMRLFATGLMSRVMDRAFPDDVPLEAKMVSRAIERAQHTVEDRNFEIRKDVLKYDEVMNEQRKIIYRRRQQILDGEDLREEAMEAVSGAVDRLLDRFCRGDYAEEWDVDELLVGLAEYFPVRLTKDELVATERRSGLEAVLQNEAVELYEEREKSVTTQSGNDDAWREIERRVMLAMIDQGWREHLYEMDYLQEGINLRAMGQRDPLSEWQREGFDMFEAMMGIIEDNFVRYMFHIDVQVLEQDERPRTPVRRLSYSAPDESAQGSTAMQAASQPRPGEDPGVVAAAMSAGAVPSPMQTSGMRASAPDAPVQPVKVEKTPGRNEPCWCGSGKKFKLCHGR
ncbi:MAG TPA: preprotein translocase subunit SecA [Acidimicrobiia bacterium]|jgi:preprotein translocase subunit SecA|nr:preprotein translocase subunit SecA [Acidimicrobiia bacterium]